MHALVGLLDCAGAGLLRLMFGLQVADVTTKMLRAVLICPDDQLSQELAVAVPNVIDLGIVRALTAYPSPEELLRLIRVRKVDLLLLCVDDFAQSEMLAKSIDDLMPGFPIVTVSSREGVEVLHKLMHLGIREHLTSPIQESTLANAVEAVKERLKIHPVSAPSLADLYTFLPAKPGVGTSTIAVSISCALAEDLGVKTLLLDSDLFAGTIQFLLKLGPTASVVDALAHAENLDEDLWFQMVGKWDKLEVLHAGELDTPPGMTVPGLERVLSMARAQYEVICADLGSHFDPLSIALLRESRRIFLMTTPEVTSLHMARARMRRLTQLGLIDRVSLLLNRKVGSVVTDSDVETTVGIPVSHSFSNDYPGVQEAILRASPVSTGSELGESILNLAHSLVPHREPIETSRRRKFLKFFHIPHMQDTDVVWHG
jgi:pilus assembly protein CpaE